jgi:AbrB family looped-hinge helix DNA binding protein
MQSKVSVRGQTVIPAPIREALGIHPQQKLVWQIENGRAIVSPLPDDPIEASFGILKRLGVTSVDIERLEEADREIERRHEKFLDSLMGID